MRSAALGPLGVLAMALGACEPDPTGWETKVDYTEQFFQPEDDVQLSRTQVLYVPVYSNILTGEGARPTEMAATLSIRNTDGGSPIFVTSVTYYDTAGQLIDTFVDGVHGLGPMASASIMINVSDTRGGLGANPVVETIMIGSSGTKGFSFTSPARVLQSSGQ